MLHHLVDIDSNCIIYALAQNTNARKQIIGNVPYQYLLSRHAVNFVNCNNCKPFILLVSSGGISIQNRILICCSFSLLSSRLLAAAPGVIVHGRALLVEKHRVDVNYILRSGFFAGGGSLSCECGFF